MGVGSRALTKHLVRRKRVFVNDEPVRKASYKLKKGDRVRVLLKEGTEKEFEYTGAKRIVLLLYKPAGYESSRKPRKHPSVYELIEGTNLAHRLEIAGRLDVDAEGLLLFTNDGGLIHRINRSKGGFSKVYEVVVDRSLNRDDVNKLLNGVESGGEILKADAVEPVSGSFAEDSGYAYRVVLSQGRFHHIKRLFSSVGAQVLSLKRLSIGKYSLGDLAPGQYRLIYEDLEED